MSNIERMNGSEWQEGVAYARGRFVEPGDAVIPIEDRAHQFGDGIYEVIRVIGGRPLLIDYHMERFEISAKAIKLRLDRSMDNLRQLVLDAIARSGYDDAQVYFQLSRGLARREHSFPDVPSHLSLTVRRMDDSVFEGARKHGLSMTWTEDVRWKYCYIKSLNLLPNVMAKQAALDEGYQDAIFVRDGFVTECTSSNIAIVKGQTVYTHPANERVLHGVTRRFALKYLREAGVEVREEMFTMEDLMQADEVFTMSTIIEFAPVIKVNGTDVGVKTTSSDSVLRRLQSAYQSQIKRNEH